MAKTESLTNDLIEQVTKFNSSIKITDFYPMESVIFYLDELDVEDMNQMLPLNSTKTVRVTYVSALRETIKYLVSVLSQVENVQELELPDFGRE
ncbi:hypothetical protein D0504_09860 [Weissella confusa]|uniref:hypothetical protein n=1 Tax=Weissella confusa TaxID=1583 RepID=UPI0021C08E6D|nr:hypothetical protein [Weissella confusa]MCT8393998.1 hypothetical protein [Weissella confusa]